MKTAGLLLMGWLAVDPYQASIRQWQQERLAKLTAEDGWLSVTGLFWLKTGRNTFGSGTSNDIVLPRGAAQAGAFVLRDGKVTFEQELKPDSDDHVTVEGLKLFVIKRGDRYGIRLKDNQSPQRLHFEGLSYFPVDPAYRVTARFVSEPAKLQIHNIFGQSDSMESPGYVAFH